MVTLIIPAYSAGPNIERTIDSCISNGKCNDVVIIASSVFLDDTAALRKLGTVVEVPWNFVFLHGFGSLHNQGTKAAKNDWLLLLGVAETFAEEYVPLHEKLKNTSPRGMLRCDHVNDPHTWKRIWNRSRDSHWSGIIHEEITGGVEGDVVFRMQDTDKTPSGDPMRQEAYRWIKALSYNHLYRELLRDSSRLGAAGRGWLKFVDGAKDSILQFCETNKAMMDACIEGDAGRFIRLVSESLGDGKLANGVQFNPQGT